MVEERRGAAWIGASLVIKGDLISSEDITIAGRIEGDVTVKGHTLTIASRASVRGNIVARAVAIQGEVIGTIKSEGKIEVGETATIEGDIEAQRMVVTEGATLRGRVQIATPAR
jgi:cytoskeletal protein CcmA (bactofilin family)